MNWFKENPFVAGLLAFTLLGAGVLAYFIMDAASANAAASEAYTGAVSKLHSLQNRSPFPSDANLKQMQQGFDAYKARVDSLRSKMQAMEVPLRQDITPQQFQDNLRTAVNDLREKAAANGVALPEKFYLGFDQYQAQVPSVPATPYLDREFGVIRSVVERLIDFKVAAIVSIERQLLPQETGGTPAAPAEGQSARPRPNDAPKVVESFPFEIAFKAEQGKVRVAFNSLLNKDQFLIVRSLELENSAPLPPSRGTAQTPENSSINALFGVQTNQPASNLKVILGRELVQATLRLEVVDFASEPQK